jgi:hypothetical protein
MTEESAKKKNQMNLLTAGQKMPDGTIYLGLYKKKDWFVAAEDAKDNKGNNLQMKFNAAAEYAKNLKAHGHDDWRVPGNSILNKMYNNKSTGAFKGTYDEGSGVCAMEGPTPWYWSSSPSPASRNSVWGQEFSDGLRHWNLIKDDDVYVRVVRAVPRP